MHKLSKSHCSQLAKTSHILVCDVGKNLKLELFWTLTIGSKLISFVQSILSIIIKKSFEEKILSLQISAC